MKLRSRLVDPLYLLLAIALCQGASFNALADGGNHQCRLLIANQLFDGVNFPEANMAVLIEGNKVKQVGPVDQLRRLCKNRINLGNATILPGFIESHAHITFQKVRKDTVLEHGITTVQDTGGPLMKPEGGQGKLRLLSAGPIIQAGPVPGGDHPDISGYPLNIFDPDDDVGGYDKIGIAVSSEREARDVVQHLVDGGATAIKIALEPGGEAGAPWMMPHGDHPVPAASWPMLSGDIVQAIVAKAHALDRRVIAHVGEEEGLRRALAGGVDELAHMPCAVIPENTDPSLDLLKVAVNQGVTFVTTIDTLGSCSGIHANAERVAKIMENTPGTESKFIYGSEVAHDNVPWGINGEEMHLMLHLTHGEGDIDFNDVVNVFRSATSWAGENMGIDKLGTLAPAAPADIIAVRGNPFKRFKILEYPDFVMSGGKIIVNKF